MIYCPSGNTQDTQTEQPRFVSLTALLALLHQTVVAKNRGAKHPKIDQIHMYRHTLYSVETTQENAKQLEEVKYSVSSDQSVWGLLGLPASQHGFSFVVSFSLFLIVSHLCLLNLFLF